jgi:hypothetical protein
MGGKGGARAAGGACACRTASGAHPFRHEADFEVALLAKLGEDIHVPLHRVRQVKILRLELLREPNGVVASEEGQDKGRRVVVLHRVHTLVVRAGVEQEDPAELELVEHLVHAQLARQLARAGPVDRAAGVGRDKRARAVPAHAAAEHLELEVGADRLVVVAQALIVRARHGDHRRRSAVAALRGEPPRVGGVLRGPRGWRECAMRQGKGGDGPGCAVVAEEAEHCNDRYSPPHDGRYQGNTAASPSMADGLPPRWVNL